MSPKPCRTDWTGRKSNLYAHSSRPLSTSGPSVLPTTAHSRKSKGHSSCWKGATVELYVYVADDKQEQSLLREQDAIHLCIVKLHPQGAAEAVSPNKPESEAQVSRRNSYPKRSESPQNGIVSGGETQAESCQVANQATLWPYKEKCQISLGTRTGGSLPSD